MHSDRDHISGVHQRDERAFAVFVGQYLESLTRYAFAMLQHESAHDVVQEVFARVWELGRDWDPRGSVTAYLFAAVRNRALNMIKSDRAGQRMRDAARAELLVQTTADDGGTDLALVACVHRELATLTERQRDALRLRYDYGHTVPQVAEILGINVVSAEKLIARGLETLRTRLARLRPELE